MRRGPPAGQPVPAGLDERARDQPAHAVPDQGDLLVGGNGQRYALTGPARDDPLAQQGGVVPYEPLAPAVETPQVDTGDSQVY